MEANAAAFEKHGYSREEMIGMRIRDLETPAAQRRWQENGAPLRKPGDAAIFESEHVRKDGSTFFVEVSAIMVRIADEPPFILTIERDITGQKQAKDALRESEERYRRIAGAVTDYIYTVQVRDGRAKETLHGPGCVTVTGYSAEEFNAAPYLWITMVVPEDRPRVIEQARRTLAGQEAPVIEHRLVRKDGRRRWVRSAIVPRRNPGGSLESYDGLIQDITERKDAEEMLRNYTNRLRTLSSRLMEARESERRHIAHELHDEVGQALTGVKLGLDGIRRRADESMAAALSGVQEELNRLMTRVRDLSLNLRPSHLDTLGLLPTLEWHFKRYTEQTGIRVDFVSDGEVPRLPSETETVLYRVVQEALTNAARHASVDAVRVKLLVNGERAQVAVEDRGKGFDAGRALESGNTLGLSGMRERVDGLGGALAIRSAPGAGTKLTVSLPLAGCRKKSRGRNSERAERAGKKSRRRSHGSGSG